MSILITGGSGMIGSRMVRTLVREGETVVVYDLTIDEEVLNYVLTPEELKSVILVQGDILDYDHLLKTCQDNGVDRMIHTASMMGNADKPLLATHVNTGGMMSVLEVARVMNLKKLVYTSTNSVFAYDDVSLIPIDGKMHPDSNYGCTKVFNEMSAEMYHRKYGLDITGLRIGAQIFGEYQRRGMTASIASEAVYKPASGQPGHVPYNESAGWIYCEDAAKVHTMALKVARTPEMPGIYNVGGQILSMEEIVAFVKKLIPDADITVENAATGMKFWNMDMKELVRDIGYTADWDVWDAWKHVIMEYRRQAGLSVEGME